MGRDGRDTITLREKAHIVSGGAVAGGGAGLVEVDSAAVAGLAAVLQEGDDAEMVKQLNT